MTPPVLTAADLAARLGQSTDWLYRAWPDLCAMDGMPRPLTRVTARRKGADGKQRRGRKPRLIWDRAAIETWIALKQPPAIRAALCQALGQPVPMAANENTPARPARAALEALDRHML